MTARRHKSIEAARFTIVFILSSIIKILSIRYVLKAALAAFSNLRKAPVR